MKLKLPNTYVLLFAILAMIAVATWLVPGGQYNTQLVKRLGAESDDVLAAFAHVHTLPAIDAERVGVMGSSFGGVNTLLAAAREPRFRCAILVGSGSRTC